MPLACLGLGVFSCCSQAASDQRYLRLSSGPVLYVLPVFGLAHRFRLQVLPARTFRLIGDLAIRQRPAARAALAGHPDGIAKPEAIRDMQLQHMKRVDVVIEAPDRQQCWILLLSMKPAWQVRDARIPWTTTHPDVPGKLFPPVKWAAAARAG